MYLPRISLAPTFVREILGTQNLPREPEPAIMDDHDQVEAFADTGQQDSTLAASYLFHTARACQAINGCRNVIDLGCGPAIQLAQIAALCPEIKFVGIDQSADMLAKARTHITHLGLTNVSLKREDITDLQSVKSHSVDGVISTVTLHHLPTQKHLEDCFREINRVLIPNGAIYLSDFGRLKSLRSILFFAYMNKDRDPHRLLLDYERSLRAAFLTKDFETLTRKELHDSVSVFSTFKIPLFVIIKTPDRPLNRETIHKLRAMREALDPRFRRDLDDMRLFFKFGGLKGDVFGSRGVNQYTESENEKDIRTEVLLN